MKPSIVSARSNGTSTSSVPGGDVPVDSEPGHIVSSVSRAVAQLCNAVPGTMAELADAVARIAPAAFASHDAVLLVRGPKAWGTVKSHRHTAGAGVLPDSHALDRLAPEGLVGWKDGVLLSLRPNKVVLLLTGIDEITGDVRVAGRLFANCLDLVIQAIEHPQTVHETQEEVFALQRVAAEILSVRESDEVLLSITHTAHKLLSADIAGVFLRDGDELVMRGCVGHRTSAFANVRMTSGQGLAGRVLETRRLVEVEDYRQTDRISDDFFEIVERESIRSALGAPLIVRGDVIGVLEVWRRRRSAFSPRQVDRLVGMANLVTIAIENARLNDAQIAILRQLELANASLEQQVETLRQSTTVQRDLIQLLLDGKGPEAIARTVATLTGCRVAIVSTNHDALATYPHGLDLTPVLAEMGRPGANRGASVPATIELRAGGGWMSMQAIHAAGDVFGYVCLLSDEKPGGALEIAVGQAAVIGALHFLEKRAADEARADARDEIIWDLLHGSLEYVRAAASRAERMRIDLRRPHRLFTGRLEGIEVSSTPGGVGPALLDRVRQEVRRIVQRISATHGGPDLVSLRGNVVVTVAPCDAASARAMVDAVATEIAAVHPGLTTEWGVSRPHCNPLEYRNAYREATIALKVAARLGANRAAVFDELGVVRLLMAPGDDPDLTEYVADVIGPIMEYDRERRTSLIKTLRAYLDTDCSLKVAAGRLFVHHKTLRYRLDRIEELTHLNLRHNEDRFRIDLALRILDVSSLKMSLDQEGA